MKVLEGKMTGACEQEYPMTGFFGTQVADSQTDRAGSYRNEMFVNFGNFEEIEELEKE